MWQQHKSPPDGTGVQRDAVAFPPTSNIEGISSTGCGFAFAHPHATEMECRVTPCKRRKFEGDTLKEERAARDTMGEGYHCSSTTSDENNRSAEVEEISEKDQEKVVLSNILQHAVEFDSAEALVVLFDKDGSFRRQAIKENGSFKYPGGSTVNGGERHMKTSEFAQKRGEQLEQEFSPSRRCGGNIHYSRHESEQRRTFGSRVEGKRDEDPLHLLSGFQLCRHEPHLQPHLVCVANAESRIISDSMFTEYGRSCSDFLQSLKRKKSGRLAADNCCIASCQCSSAAETCRRRERHVTSQNMEDSACVCSRQMGGHASQDVRGATSSPQRFICVHSGDANDLQRTRGFEPHSHQVGESCVSQTCPCHEQNVFVPTYQRPDVVNRSSCHASAAPRTFKPIDFISPNFSPVLSRLPSRECLSDSNLLIFPQYRRDTSDFEDVSSSFCVEPMNQCSCGAVNSGTVRRENSSPVALARDIPRTSDNVADKPMTCKKFAWNTTGAGISKSSSFQKLTALLAASFRPAECLWKSIRHRSLLRFPRWLATMNRSLLWSLEELIHPVLTSTAGTRTHVETDQMRLCQKCHTQLLCESLVSPAVRSSVSLAARYNSARHESGGSPLINDRHPLGSPEFREDFRTDRLFQSGSFLRCTSGARGTNGESITAAAASAWSQGDLHRDPRLYRLNVAKCIYLDVAATTIQRFYRGHLARRRVAHFQKMRAKLRTLAHAAEVIQRAFREAARRSNQKLEALIRMHQAVRQIAATKIQRGWKCFRAKQHRMTLELVNVIRGVRNLSAQFIQKVWRGYRTRRILDEEWNCWVIKWMWDPPGHVVEVVGDFTDPPWKVRHLMRYCPVRRCYVAAFPRREGRFELKFEVDGRFVVCGSNKLVEDGGGEYNNVVFVNPVPSVCPFVKLREEFREKWRAPASTSPPLQTWGDDSASQVEVRQCDQTIPRVRCEQPSDVNNETFFLTPSLSTTNEEQRCDNIITNRVKVDPDPEAVVHQAPTSDPKPRVPTQSVDQQKQKMTGDDSKVILNGGSSPPTDQTSRRSTPKNKASVGDAADRGEPPTPPRQGQRRQYRRYRRGGRFAGKQNDNVGIWVKKS